MADQNTYKWEQEVLGEHIVYPSHPLAVACMIMDRYHNYEHATQRHEPHGFTSAASDSFIPGAGCAVSTGTDVLKTALQGYPDMAIARAHDYIEGYPCA